MLKDIVKKLKKHHIINEDDIQNPLSRYHYILQLTENKYPQLTAFFIVAHYRYLADLAYISRTFKMYKKLKSCNIKIDIGKFRHWEFSSLAAEIFQLYNNRFDVPKFILNNIKEFKNILHDSNYIIIACLSIKNDCYVDDFRTMKYFSSPFWCIIQRNTFIQYTTHQNSIQYILIKKTIFKKYKQRQQLSQIHINNITERIGITLKRNKKLRNKTGLFSIFINNAKIICHDDYNRNIRTLRDFKNITNSFPIWKVHNTLIKIINNNQILEL